MIPKALFVSNSGVFCVFASLKCCFFRELLRKPWFGSIEMRQRLDMSLKSWGTTMSPRTTYQQMRLEESFVVRLSV